MKKFICCMTLMMAALVTSAATQMEFYNPPEYDISYDQVTVDALSMDGITIDSFDSQWNITDLQALLMLNIEVGKMSVRVVDAYSIACNEGDISMTLVSYRWPIMKNKKATSQFKFHSEYVPDGFTHSFTPSLTDFA